MNQAHPRSICRQVAGRFGEVQVVGAPGRLTLVLDAPRYRHGEVVRDADGIPVKDSLTIDLDLISAQSLRSAIAVAMEAARTPLSPQLPLTRAERNPIAEVGLRCGVTFKSGRRLVATGGLGG